MNSRQHALHAAVLAVALLVVAPPPAHPLFLVGFVLFVGVGIDADHFLIARVNTGSWNNLRRVIRDPRLVFFDQSSIFDTLDVWAEDRLLSHLLLGGIGVIFFWAVGQPYWAGVAAAALYTHILADVYDDRRYREQRAVEKADALDSSRGHAG